MVKTKLLKRNISQVYFILVPILASAIGLGIGYVSYKIYLPIWIINVCLMIMATWILSVPAIRSGDIEKKHIVACTSLLIVPWMFISMIAGLGAPPFGKPAVWLASITEQEIRYIILIIAAVLYALGFAILREKLKPTKGNLYSLLGSTVIQIAIPLFLIDMIFLSYYVEEMYRIMAKSSLEKIPEWALPMANQSRYIPIVEGSLIYIATAAFAASLKTAGWLKPTACNIYIIMSLLGVLLNMLPPSVPEPLATISFIATIPAALFVMPYLMGINLLRRAGN
jgi:hypothetical protein